MSWVCESILRNADTAREHIAIEHGEKHYSYATVNNLSNGMAAFLQTRETKQQKVVLLTNKRLFMVA